MSVNIPAELKSRSTFLISIALGLEKKSRFSSIATVIRTVAKYVDLPKLVVSDAKTHSLACKNSIGTATPTNETIQIDTKTDHSVDYCDEDFYGDEVGFKQKTQEKQRNVIQSKLNTDFATAALAGATNIVATVALGTADEVADFLNSIDIDAQDVYFDWAPSVQNGRVERAQYHGRGFVIAGTTAYKAIKAKADSIRFQSTTKTLSSNDSYFMSDQGVVVINGGSTLGDVKQLVHGVAGAPVHAYRADNLREFDDKIVSRTTAGVNDGDLLIADAVVQRDYNMGAEIWNKAFIPASVTAYVSKQLMT